MVWTRSRAHGGWTAFARASADLLWPPVSLLGEARVDRLGTLEAERWVALPFLFGPGCAHCGVPLPEATQPDTICPACLVDPPAFDGARAALAYDETTRPLVLALKHAGRQDGLPAFASWMAEALGAGFATDVVVPVPLHWTRLWSRGFNQSARLAGALAQRLGVAHAPDLLIRTRRTPSQNGLSAAGRARNVRAAFAVDPRRALQVSGQRVLLVDDVHTTGATTGACARALRKAGALRVDVVALARVVGPRAPDLDLDAPMFETLTRAVA
jgi:ComF family protein